MSDDMNAQTFDRVSIEQVRLAQLEREEEIDRMLSELKSKRSVAN